MIQCQHCSAEYSTVEELANHRVTVWDHLPDRLDKSQAESRRLLGLIARDHTGLAAAIVLMVKEARFRLWITEGRGSYEWDDEDYQKEAGRALNAIIEIGTKALSDSGTLADSAFHPERSRP